MNASVHLESSASSSLVAILRQLPSQSRILNLGGWFCPLHEATDVVDLMPYETRRGRLALEPLPGERFTRADWHQADFMAPGFRLPFDDKCCDFAYCGQTVEDLPDPARLLQEMMRVARAGFIRSPSRLIEQSRGVSDRQTSRPGFAHHRYCCLSAITNVSWQDPGGKSSTPWSIIGWANSPRLSSVVRLPQDWPATSYENSMCVGTIVCLIPRSAGPGP